VFLVYITIACILKAEVMIMAEEKAALKQLFVYEHDAGRVELFVRVVYAYLSSGL